MNLYESLKNNLKEAEISNIVSELYNDFKDSPKATERKIWDLINHDTFYIIQDGNVWWFEKVNSNKSIPNYCHDYLRKYIKKYYGLDYLYDVAPVGKSINEAEGDKKFRITWKYNINEHTGDAEDSGTIDIMAKDEEDAERKAYKELDRIPYDEFYVENVSDAEVFGIAYKGQFYKKNGLQSGRDPETERIFVSGSEDEVKAFSRKLVGKFIEKVYTSGEVVGAYKCLSIREVYVAAVPKTDETLDVNDPAIFEKLQGSFKPFDLSHQKELQEKILKDFKAQVKEEHYRGDAFFEMDDEKLDKPGYVGTLCIRSWNLTNGDMYTLQDICESFGCKSERDRNYENMSYYCFAIYEKGGKE